ncbi:MAG TPA: hypothetical protein HPP65_11635, partial [Gammaproteobacteria bacterium]|nr:hypothetical protein [Gammaproteobacteria bacterium]
MDKESNKGGQSEVQGSQEVEVPLVYQIQVSYVAVEDRLMLRVLTKQGEEFTYWVTRRLSNGLITGMYHMLGIDRSSLEQGWSKEHAGVPTSQDVQQEIRSMQLERKQQNLDHTTQYGEGVERVQPEGISPQLIRRINFQPSPPYTILQIDSGSGSSHRFGFNNELLAGMLKGVEGNVKKNGWVEPFSKSGAIEKTSDGPDVDPDRTEEPI